MNYESKFIDCDGVVLHYLHWAGHGPPVVILHGNTHCGGVYAPLAARLASDFEVLAVDLRGHGLSDKPADYSWTAFRSDILSLLEQRDLRDVLLVAHSRGGGIALLTACAAPSRVRGVVAYEPTTPLNVAREAGAPSGVSPERAQRLVAQVEGRRSRFSGREEMFRHFKGRGAFRDWREEYLRAFVQHGAIASEDGGVELASPVRVEQALYLAMVGVAPWDALSPCDVPVLAAFGDRSGRMTPGQDPVAKLRAVFPRIESRVLPGCSHSGPMEHPELFEAAIRDFAARL